MLAPRTRIILVRSIAAATGTVLLVAALGITNNFDLLKLVITTGFVLLAALSFLMNYRDLGIAELLLAILFNPFVPITLPRHIWVTVDIITFAGIIYYTYWTTNPYWKGTRFEQYVSTLFPEPNFVVVDRTRDVSKFLNRRVESDSHPDFVFRNQKTGKNFAVECKWRGRWAYDKNREIGLWWNRWQGDRYARYEKESGIPVHIALGIGGSPERPNEIYFLEPSRLQYSFLKQSLIRSGKSASQL